jgi:phosphoenolpyruvate-protein kinase (PTS system EI component)
MSIRIYSGDPIAPGFAVGRLHVSAARARVQPSAGPPCDPLREIDRFRCQVDALEREIAQAVDRLESEAFRAEAEIMRTHLAMLRDPDLHRQILELIRVRRHRAETAVEQVLERMAAMLAGANDPVLSERAADLRDLASRLAAGLADGEAFDPAAEGMDEEGGILAVAELMPSLVLAARDLGVTGFVVGQGTAVSHGAILAKSFGIPVVRVACLDFANAFAEPSFSSPSIR